MKALFFGLPVHGHMNPALSLVRELTRRGDDIQFFSTRDFEARIIAAGATFRPYRNSFLPELGTVARRIHELTWLFMRTSSELLAEELDDFRADTPDYLITDSVAPWGQWVGEILRVPVVTSTTTFAFNRHVLRYGFSRGVRPREGRQFASKIRHIAKAARLMYQLRRRYGVRGPGLIGNMSRASGLSLVYTSRAFQPRVETFDSRYRFVGPLLADRSDASDFPWGSIDGRTVVYVSLGTLFNAEPGFYRACFDAFRDVDAAVVLSIGNRVANDTLGAPPQNVIVRAHVPQLELLARASAFVTHGGMNSVSESLYHGVPVAVIPHTGEQEIVGRRAEELGAGVVIAKNAVTPHGLRAAVVSLLERGEFRSRAREIGEGLRAAGGAAAAADAVFEYTRRADAGARVVSLSHA